MAEENNIIPIGSIVKITTDKNLGDLNLYVNYGVKLIIFFSKIIHQKIMMF